MRSGSRRQFHSPLIIASHLHIYVHTVPARLFGTDTGEKQVSEFVCAVAEKKDAGGGARKKYCEDDDDDDFVQNFIHKISRAFNSHSVCRCLVIS